MTCLEQPLVLVFFRNICIYIFTIACGQMFLFSAAFAFRRRLATARAHRAGSVEIFFVRTLFCAVVKHVIFELLCLAAVCGLPARWLARR